MFMIFIFRQAVTRKFVHEESGGVTALCGAVESCLGQGLRRRALGLFKTSSTTALLHKIAKVSESVSCGMENRMYDDKMLRVLISVSITILNRLIMIYTIVYFFFLF